MGLWTTRSRTEAPPSSSVIVAPVAAALGERDVLEPRLGAEDREDGERAGDVGVADTQIAADEVADG